MLDTQFSRLVALVLFSAVMLVIGAFPECHQEQLFAEKPGCVADRDMFYLFHYAYFLRVLSKPYYEQDTSLLRDTDPGSHCHGTLRV
jgi:hypothetical protein